MDIGFDMISDPSVMIPADNSGDLFFNLFNSIFDAVCVFELCDRKVKARYLSSSYFDVVGYTREQYLPYYDNVTVTLFEEDEKRLISAAIKSRTEGGELLTQVRGYRHDDSVGWFGIRARAVDFIKCSNPVFVASISDISHIKDMEKKLYVKEERTRILEETSTAFLFEYSYNEDKMIFSPGKNMDEIVIPAYTSYLRRGNQIYDEDVINYCTILFKACRSLAKGFVDVRSLRQDKTDYITCRIYYSSIADELGIIISVVGRVEVIDETSGLACRIGTEANLRGMSGSELLWNNIRSRIAEKGRRSFIAAIDIDGFTGYVKKHGREKAEKTVEEVFGILTEAFPEDSLVFRYESDEFIVFTEDITEGALHDIFDRISEKAAAQTGLSLSAGAAWTEKGEKANIKDYFVTACRALFKAKDDGKGRMYAEQIIF